MCTHHDSQDHGHLKNEPCVHMPCVDLHPIVLSGTEPQGKLVSICCTLRVTQQVSSTYSSSGMQPALHHLRLKPNVAILARSASIPAMHVSCQELARARNLRAAPTTTKVGPATWLMQDKHQVTSMQLVRECSCKEQHPDRAGCGCIVYRTCLSLHLLHLAGHAIQLHQH